MHRTPGKLVQLTAQTLPHHLLFLDTETHIIEQPKGVFTFPLRLGIAIYIELKQIDAVKSEEIYLFRTPEEFIDIITKLARAKTKLYIFGHNVGFDIRVLNLPELMAREGYVSEPPIVNQRVFIWSLRKDKSSIVFLDTANFGAISVDQLGKDFNCPKLEVNFDTVTDRELITYCTQDARILKIFMLAYIRFIYYNGLGSFKMTLAGQAMCAWRTRFIMSSIYIHNNIEALHLERCGYHGGRVECFFIGEKNSETYYYTDVNSLYSAAMINTKMPIQLLGISHDVPVHYMEPRLKLFYCIADVTVKVDVPCFAYKNTNKLIFPIGEYRTVLHQRELEFAYEHNMILKVHTCLIYLPEDIFSQYVDFFYTAKVKATIEGNKSNRAIAKLFQNALYGKYGQLLVNRTKIGQCDNSLIWRLPIIDSASGRHYIEYGWSGSIYRELREGETATSSPAIAGAVTANARMLLWDYMTIAHRKNVLYCDTDSMITNETGYNNLFPYISPTELGKLKLEQQSNVVSIRGPKDYQFGDIVRVKGVPRKAKPLPNDRWEYLQFQGFITWLNEGAQGPPTAHTRIKQRKAHYDKGIVLSTGEVIPIELPLLTQ